MSESPFNIEASETNSNFLRAVGRLCEVFLNDYKRNIRNVAELDRGICYEAQPQNITLGLHPEEKGDIKGSVYICIQDATSSNPDLMHIVLLGADVSTEIFEQLSVEDRLALYSAAYASRWNILDARTRDPERREMHEAIAQRRDVLFERYKAMIEHLQ